MFSRSFLCGLLALCGAGTTSLAQVPAVPLVPRPHSLGLDAEAVDAGEAAAASPAVPGTPVQPIARPAFTPPKVRVTKDTDSIKLTVRNFGSVPDTAHVEWYFVATTVGVDATGLDYILAESSRDVPLAAGARESFSVASPVVEVTETLPGGNSRAKKSLAEREKGSTLRGWFARIVMDGRVIAARGSSQTYEDTAKDEAKLAVLKSVPPPRAPRKRRSS